MFGIPISLALIPIWEQWLVPGAQVQALWGPASGVCAQVGSSGK